MNIFVLDSDPEKAAQSHVDKHVCKMVIELMQQLATAAYLNGANEKEMPLTQSGLPIKPAHRKHPCTLFCAETRSNFDWAVKHAIALSREYSYRYGREHACDKKIHILSNLRHKINQGPLTEFAQAMPDEFKHSNPVEAYRDYYWFHKRISIPCVWTKREKPDWWLSRDLIQSDNSL